MLFHTKCILFFILFNIIFVNAQLSSKQRDLLLSLHRQTREDVGASNMKPLNWSSELAAAAQDYAEECNGMVHSGVMGENLASATYDDIERLYRLWEEERDMFEQSDSFRKSFSGSHSFGHYTQIVWAANTKVGCGYAYCGNSSQSYYLVCRYELGNIIGYEVYSYSKSTVDIPNIVKNKSSGNDDYDDEDYDEEDYDEEYDDEETKQTTKTSSNKTSNKSSSSSSSSDEERKTSQNKSDNTSKTSDNTSKSSSNKSSSDKSREIEETKNDKDSKENKESTSKNNEDEDTDKDTDNKDTDNKDTDNKDTSEESSVGNGVDVVAKDDGKGGVVLVVLGGTAASGAFALLYVKKKKPDQYQKICRQISMQQREIGKITKKLTVKVGSGTTTIGKKLIERSKSSNGFAHIKNAHIFSRSKSTNDIRIKLSDDSILPYEFNINNNYNDMNKWNTFSRTEDRKSIMDNSKSYRTLSIATLHRKMNKPDIIEKMNNLDKYEQYINKEKTTPVNESIDQPFSKCYQSPIMKDRKVNDIKIEYNSNRNNYSNNSPSLNRYNDIDKENKQPNCVVIDPSIQPPLPTRFKSNKDTNRNLTYSPTSRLSKSSSLSRLSKSSSLRSNHRYQKSDSETFHSLSRISNKSYDLKSSSKYQEPEVITFPRRERSLSVSSNHSTVNNRGRKGYTNESSYESLNRRRSRSRNSSPHPTVKRRSSRSSLSQQSESRSRNGSPHPSFNRRSSVRSSQQSLPERIPRKPSLNGRKQRGKEHTTALNHRRSQSHGSLHRSEQYLRSSSSSDYYNLDINDLIESYD